MDRSGHAGQIAPATAVRKRSRLLDDHRSDLREGGSVGDRASIRHNRIAL